MGQLINQFGKSMLTKPSFPYRDDAVAALWKFIATGSFRPGDRLPPERELTVILGMSRSMLRGALDALEREGAIWRHVGKGTFVAARGDSADTGSLSELTRQVTPIQLMRARLSLEPAISREAALNASNAAVIRLKLSCGRCPEAADWEAYEAHDDAFHRTIAEATDNVLLLSLFNQLNQVRRAVAWGTFIRQSPQPAHEHPSFAEHSAVVAAIEARDPLAAHAAMRVHLSSVSSRLFGED